MELLGERNVVNQKIQIKTDSYAVNRNLKWSFLTEFDNFLLIAVTLMLRNWAQQLEGLMAKKPFNERLLMLSRAKDISQAEIAREIEMQQTHLSRYFNGHADISSSRLINILKVLNIDLEEIVDREILKLAGGEEDSVADLSASIHFLLNSLDPVGKQALLTQILWSAKKTSKKRIPERIESMVKKEISLI